MRNLEFCVYYSRFFLRPYRKPQKVQFNSSFRAGPKVDEIRTASLFPITILPNADHDST